MAGWSGGWLEGDLVARASSLAIQNITDLTDNSGHDTKATFTIINTCSTEQMKRLRD